MILLDLPFSLILYSLCVGLIICIIYLWLLWITVKNLNKVKHPLLLFFISLIGRFTVLFCLALFFAQQNPARFLWIMIGFIVSRFCLVSLVKSRRKNDSKS